MSKRHKKRDRKSARAPARPRRERASPPSLADLCAGDEQMLSNVDVAVLNLLCATGLPGAEGLAIERLLDWLDDAADRVNIETRRHWYRFRQSPATYQNSAGYFCCYFLLQVLQEDFGVKYNPERARDPSFQDHRRVPDFRDSRDLFIHGIIDGQGGTCGSMPVIYLAVGRRLGYPLKLVEARGHMFIRWDDPLGTRFGVPERFNIEGAGYGMSSFPDAYYETWPEPWTSAERAAGCYLKSLSPREELASFLGTRAQCLIDNRRPVEASKAYRLAVGLAPNDLRYRNELARLLRLFSPSPDQIYQHAMAMARQNQWRQHQLSVMGGALPPPIIAGHARNCPCHWCQQARDAQRSQPRPFGHDSQCQCFRCQQTRRAQQSQPRPNGHALHCACFYCQKAARAANSSWPGMAGMRQNPFFPQ